MESRGKGVDTLTVQKSNPTLYHIHATQLGEPLNVDTFLGQISGLDLERALVIMVDPEALNAEQVTSLARKLSEATGKPVFVVPHGVDLFGMEVGELVEYDTDTEPNGNTGTGDGLLEPPVPE